MDKKSLIIITILLAWAIGATTTTVIYYNEFQKYYEKYQNLTQKTIMRVSFGINYGNGTLVWYNDTPVINGSTVYEALLLIADVNATTTPFGVYVRGINGVNDDPTHAWLYAINRNDSSVNAWFSVNGWYYPGVGADSLTLKNGDIVVWIFLNWVEHYPPPDPTTRENVR